MNKKMNNKGFSLVELIVVIAIMGILAVTLAPRLTQYVDRARTAADRDTVSSIFNAAKLANAEFPLPDTYSLTLGLTTPEAPLPATPTALYYFTGDRWTLNAAYVDPAADTTDDFYGAFTDILSGFTLQSPNSGANTQITLSVTSGVISVTLDYDTTENEIDTVSISE